MREQTNRCAMIETFGLLEEDLARRSDPNYSRLTGLVNKDLAHRVRIFCATEQTTISELMEAALADYLEKKSKEDSNLKKESKSD